MRCVQPPFLPEGVRAEVGRGIGRAGAGRADVVRAIGRAGAGRADVGRAIGRAGAGRAIGRAGPACVW